jgi:methyl coenzyme M reductase beta subunit
MIKTAKDLGFIAVPLTGIATFLTYGLLGSRISEQKMQEATKPLIENVDSIANKAKAVKPILEDSFKLGKKVIRK